MKRIGLIGGLSWESTASYYALLNRLTAAAEGPWRQPEVVIDSLNFHEIVELQRRGDWVSTGRLLADSARRLEAAGATVLAIGANTMHKNFDDVAGAVTVPVLDVRDALANEVLAKGATSMTLLGTKYLMVEDFYVASLERAGLRVVRPRDEDVAVLHAMIYDELTQGVITDASRSAFLAIAERCRERGGEVVGLCCTEFGLLLDEATSPWPTVDSTKAHVRALVAF